MASTVLFPRLDARKSISIRRQVLRNDVEGTIFDIGLFEESFQDPRAFPPTGGVRIGMGELTDLRAELRAAAQRARGLPVGSVDASFDLEIGRVLARKGERSRGDFGEPRVWDFLTLVLVPDLAVQRLHIGTEPVSTSSSAAKRITGGDRRHVFQKLWKRWQAFGADVVESGRLTEDDYVATLERNITLERGKLARGVANAIVTSSYTGTARREYTRVFMRNLQQASGLVQIRDDDASHTSALIAHVHRQTVDALR